MLTINFTFRYLILFTIFLGQCRSYIDWTNGDGHSTPLLNKILQLIPGLDFFEIMRDSYPLPDGHKEPLREYDFIIVGAGSAGSALAAKLSDNKNTTVLLLEVGKPESFFTDVPVLAPLFQSTDYVWHYYMEHQPNVCMGMNNQRCFWPRGKAIGGTSVVNYMIYTRGRPQDWDRISDKGNYGWSYQDVIKYYIEMEQSLLDGYEKEPHRGREGEMPVTFPPWRIGEMTTHEATFVHAIIQKDELQDTLSHSSLYADYVRDVDGIPLDCADDLFKVQITQLLHAFLKAGRILGKPTIDYNAPGKLGFGRLQYTAKNGHRYSAAKVFLHKRKNQSNLHILRGSRVLQILIDSKSKNAYGVKYQYNKNIQTVIARNEIILSAGPIASPQLLMLSGIGVAEHLNSLGIPLIQDLPVGQTLYDHITFPGLIFTLNETVSLIESRVMNARKIFAWLTYGDNELSSPTVEAIGYIKTNISDDPDPDFPDIELLSIGGSILSDGGIGSSKSTRRGMRINEEIFNEAFGSIDGTDAWSAFPMLLYPESFGRLKLKDKNPFSDPLIYGNYLTKRKDVDTFIAAIRYIQKLTSTTPFQKFGAKIHPAKYKLCSKTKFDSDEYWECALRILTVTLHHQVATCRMGPEGDESAVVDPELRVKGIHNLRVADSSILPHPIAAHTHAPATVIGFKAASLIKSTWKL